jgi:pilus assembly protein Flp/PilA
MGITQAVEGIGPLHQGDSEMTQYNFLRTWLTAHIGNERGAALVEYALLVALIAVVCIGAITFLGNSADTKFSSVGSQLG